MVRTSATKVPGDVTEVKRRVSTALDRYAAFAGAVRRADVSAQLSGVKVLEGLAHIAVQEQLLLRNSPDLRRFFATAINKTDLAALLRSPAVPVQLAALRASNALSQHVETLTSSTVPVIVRQLQSTDGASELAVSTLRHLIRPFGPSTVWQAIHDGKGDEMMLDKLESWVKGGSSAAPHLQLVCFLLQSSLAAQRQLLEDPGLAERWTRGLLKLLQQPLASDDLQLAAAAVHAVSSMTHFIQHVQADASLYYMLTHAAAHALHSGTRLQWRGAAGLAHTACDLLDGLAGLTPPHVCHAAAESSWQGQAISVRQRHEEPSGIGSASQLAHALRQLLPNSRAGLEMHSARHKVLSSALKAVCVLLLPPHFTHGSDARASPWLTALGPSLSSRLIALLSKDGSDMSVDTWCWQALYLLQAQLSPSQQDQILQHPTAQHIPPTSILTLEPLFCAYSALRLVLACRSGTKSTSTPRHYTAAKSGSAQAPGSSWQPGAARQLVPEGSQSCSIGSNSQPEGNSSLPTGNHSQSSQSIGRHLQPRWPNEGQGQRHHLLLPKALPQGNLSRYFDLACVTSGLRCLHGQQDAWQDAWLVLCHALGNLSAEGGAAWTSAVIASLQALTEAGAAGSLPPHICNQLAQLATTHSSRSCSTASTAVSPPELAYGDRDAGSGRADVKVPPPLQQQENTQLQLWWAVATAAACGQLGLPCDLGATMQGLLADESTADVVFELQTSPGELIMAHTAIIAAGCPKLYKAVQQQQQQQQQQQHNMVRKAMHIHLGKSVRAGPLQQVLEYLYTGQVRTLSSDEDRRALRKLAHALELPQLAALAAGRRPTPGAVYSFLTLAEVMPTQLVQIPWESFNTGADSQQLEEQRQDMADATCPEGVSAGGDEVEASGGLYSRQHPSIQDLHDFLTEVKGQDRLAVPASVPGHLDILLVPRQDRHLCHVSRSSSPTADVLERCGHACHTNPVAKGQGHDATCPQQQEAQAHNAVLGEQQCLQVWPAHRAILSATSAYFAAMLSDRWHASSAAGMPCGNDRLQDSDGWLPATFLHNKDMEVLSAFVCFCYTHELMLQPCSPVDFGVAAADCCITSGRCHHCWNARTAVRLSVAAEAWMVPALQDKCLAFLTDHVPALPPECQIAVHADMTAVHAWDLAQQLNLPLGKKM